MQETPVQFLGWDDPHITVIQVYDRTSNAKEAEFEWILEDLPTRPSRSNTQKDNLFIIGDWNAEVGNQEASRITGKFGHRVQNEAGLKLTVLQENTLVIANTLFQQYKRGLYTWTLPDGKYQNQIDYILCSQRWRRCM